MPLQQGEVSLLTLFADVHSYFGAPTAKPVHHRFDRKSYLYLYHDALNKRGRIEIANNAGTPDQDAFSGYLENARVEYSYKQPTLFTITADSSRPHSGSPQNDISQWHIPAFDLRHEHKYMYKITTIDVYLWTVDDAGHFLDSLRRVLEPHQLVLLDVPANILAEHRDSMSPVVQQLERIAVTSGPIHQRQGSTGPTQAVQGFPPPPPATGTPSNNPSSPPATQTTFAPMAYNPAAPAAPEHRVHREKTPPPPDAENGTGLTGGATHDQPSQFAGPPQGGFAPQQQPSYFTGPPSAPPQGVQRTNTTGSLPGPPPSQSPYHHGATPSFAPPPQATPPQDPNAHLYSRTQEQQHSSHPQTQHANYPTQHTPGPTSPGLTSPRLPQSPFYPPSNFYQLPQTATNYPYNPQQTTHNIHQQVYQPETEGAKPAQAGAGQAPPGKLEQRLDKYEKGVGKFLKKLDKKW